MIQIKVCGITRIEDALYAVKLGVNALGFILADSPRQIGLGDIKKISSFLPPFVSRVAVVVDPSSKELKEIVDSKLFDYIQFHGTEKPQIIKSMPLKSIKAVSIAEKDDLKNIDKYRDADYFLFDTRIDDQIGGTGKTFNWDLLKKVAHIRPFILAGGLGPHNIIQAIEIAKPAAVDINSRVEKNPGLKDYKLLRETILKIRSVDLENNRKCKWGC